MKSPFLNFAGAFCLILVACSSDTRVDDTLDFGQDIGLDATCQHWHFPQDYTYGENCWGPPHNLCRNGADTMASWFCKADGSACCLTASSDCFFCGWINCQSYEEGVSLSPECAVLDIEQKYIDCGTDNEACLPAVLEEMTNSSLCVFHFQPNAPEHTYCWDEYLD